MGFSTENIIGNTMVSQQLFASAELAYAYSNVTGLPMRSPISIVNDLTIHFDHIN